MAEIEANRDYYGPVRFDDIAFQMSPAGQQLQARFVASYAERLHHDIEGEIALPAAAPISRPGVGSRGDVRGSVRLGSVPGNLSNPSSAPDDIGRAVDRVQSRGGDRVDSVGGYLDRRTRNARGATEEAADEIKEW